MTLDELRKTKVGQLAINRHLGGVEKPVAKPDPTQALDSCRKVFKERTACMVTVSLVRWGRKLLDSDNLQGGIKPLRDAVAASLGVDDGDPRIKWEYGQALTTGEEGVIVKIEMTAP